MGMVTSPTCSHGVPPATCQICRVLDATPVPQGRRTRPARRTGFPGSLATVAIVAIVGLVVVGWVAAAFFAVLRIVELVAVAALVGWVAWRLGVRRGRSGG